MKKLCLFACLLSALNPILALEPEPRAMPKNGIDKALLGQILFFDNSLSFQGNQNCASCHNPDTAFVDLRDNSAQRMVSAGDDPHKFGNRNAPTMLYAKFSPDFHFDPKNQRYVGGQFWDGRARDLAEQSGGPPINPVEMGMPSKQAVAERLLYNPMYMNLLTQHYGEQVWASVDNVYNAMEDAIATFQQQKHLLSPFDSQYDKYLQGINPLTPEQEKGRQLFFDKKRTNCSNCHQLQEMNHPQETFSNYAYYNLGVPSNQQLIAHNQLNKDFIDNGLFDNPMLKGDQAHKLDQKGKFKTPTLRNIAVTGPYMHNGVFRELRTVLLFLDSANNSKRKINPETKQPWQPPEYAPTVSHQDLNAPSLTDDEIIALEAFLESLTDQRYLPILEKIKAEK